MNISLSLPYPPSANNYWRVTKFGKTYVSNKARSYKSAVAMLLLTKKLKPFVNAVSVSIDVYRPERRGDLDNSLKVLIDALKGFAFRDDSQVVELRARRFDDAKNPRVEVLVTDIAFPKVTLG